MQNVLEYLKACGTFYLATVDNGVPRVRPFGAVTEFEGKCYIITNNQKEVFKQMALSPRIEISGMNGGTWIRLEATAVNDDSRAVKEKFLADYPMLSNMYSADDGKMAVLYLKDATATVFSFSGEPVTYTF